MKVFAVENENAQNGQADQSENGLSQKYRVVINPGVQNTSFEITCIFSIVYIPYDSKGALCKSRKDRNHPESFKIAEILRV